ncbi:MAG: glycerophosphodiester phosphodiesterase [Acidobacteria bacterium]|nr:glycerophosphodiester phosphodiesterase [Acidobacteriota bacterium]
MCGRPLIIGHRGFRARYPENSVAGVRAALAAGADGVEIDIRPTADGVWVAHHDLRRAGRHSRDWTWTEMKGEGVDSLDGILKQLDDRHWLFLEIKPLPGRWLEPLLEELVAAVGPHGNRTRIISSSARILLKAAEAFDGGHFSLIVKHLGLTPLPEAWSLSPHHVLVERLLPTGRELHPWTVNRPRRMLELARLGLPSLTTDNPEVALFTLGSRRRQNAPAGPSTG